VADDLDSLEHRRIDPEVMPMEEWARRGTAAGNRAPDPDGLGLDALARLERAQAKSAWGTSHRRRFALVQGADLLASAEQHRLTGMLDQRLVTICAVGGVRTEPRHGDGRHARELVEQLFREATREGVDVALLFGDAGRFDVPDEFEVIPALECELEVAESPRHGAPMTLVRSGEDRDLAAIVAMGQTLATRFRFRIERDVDLVKDAITSKRLVAGLSAPGRRQLHFVIAEEGITAAAYVVLSVVGRTWTIEEYGDRDPSAARVGAILQALIARDPIEERPTITARVPSAFVPPQVTLRACRPAAPVMMVRSLRPTLQWPRLAPEDVLSWHSDVF
jgi:hypothetical protein